MKDSRICEGKRIEWTGAGGDYFLAIVVQEDEVIAERWGTRQDILAWMETNWPQLPEKYVPMAYVPRRRRSTPTSAPPLRSKSHHAA
ncbi:MAG TPA: hypothetical protein VGR73_13445 [Bryobacteraceae bacterium]|nr:hypothetical protein [Bryobacteraceae bacterium]